MEHITESMYYTAVNVYADNVRNQKLSLGQCMHDRTMGLHSVYTHAEHMSLGTSAQCCATFFLSLEVFEIRNESDLYKSSL